jgi:elongator complex protein 3
MVPLDNRIKDTPKLEVEVNKTRPWQHQGYGKMLLTASEQFARENWDAEKLLVMSGVGVKPYYTKFGYNKDGVYMRKNI